MVENVGFCKDWAVVFIDGGYLEKVKDGVYGSNIKVDLECLSEKLAEPHKRFRTYYYNAYPYQNPNDPTDDEKKRFSKAQRFYDRLNKLNRFEVRLGKTVKRYSSDGSIYYTQKGVDVYFSIDILKVAWSGYAKYIVLLAGDSDFVPAIKAAKEKGAIVKLIYCDSNGPPNDLLNTVDERIPLSKELFDDCKLS